MGRHALNSEEFAEWLFEQEGFVVIGSKDGVVNIKTSVDLEEAADLVEVAYHMTQHALEGGDPKDLMNLH